MDQNQPPFPLLLAMLLAIGGSISVWCLIYLRRRDRLAIVPREPRRRAPWNVFHVIGAVLIFVLCIATVQSIVLTIYHPQRPAAVDDNGGGVRKVEVADLLSQAIGSIIAIALISLWYRIHVGASGRDLGLLPWRPSYDVPLGFAAFLASLLPVYAIQVVLTQFFPSKHPVQQLLTSDSSTVAQLTVAFSAVIAAPIAEEFLFRGILQGWLEAAVLRRRTFDSPPHDQESLPPWPVSTQPVEPIADSAITSDSGVNTYQSRAPLPLESPLDASTADEPRTRLERLLPLGVSSFLFAIVHIGNGPDPIPLFVLALILGYLYQQTHRLWPCIMLHMCLNAASLAMLLAARDAQ